jgi:hypothetical protein
MKFYKSVPTNLERGNIKLGKYKVSPSYLERVPKSRWKEIVTNKKDMLLTLLNPIGREWAEGEVYCLFLVPNNSYIIEIDDYSNEAYFRKNSNNDIENIIEGALFMLFDKEIKIRKQKCK